MRDRNWRINKNELKNIRKVKITLIRYKHWHITNKNHVELEYNNYRYVDLIGTKVFYDIYKVENKPKYRSGSKRIQTNKMTRLSYKKWKPYDYSI